MVKEEKLYEPVRKWFESQGFNTAITAYKRQVSLWLGMLLPCKLYLEPHIVGIKDGTVAIVEVEVKSDPSQILDALGRCLIFLTAADEVYLALPKSSVDAIQSTKLFEQLGIGLLQVAEATAQAAVLVKPNRVRRGAIDHDRGGLYDQLAGQLKQLFDLKK